MEKERNKILFEKLKKCISNTFLQEYSSSNPEISHWKGIDIVYFQEHLLKKVRANVSEKWFYTYFKSDFDKLPRIDMLNLLSQYAGFMSWADFCEKNKAEVEHLKEKYTFSDALHSDTNKAIAQEITEKGKFYNNKIIQRSFMGLVLVSFLILAFITYKKNTEYDLYFYDADKKTLIKNLEIKPLFGSNAEIKVDKEDGYFTVNTNFSDDSITLSINSNYYKADTIKINLKESTGKESISLIPNDFANILYYYSKIYNKDIKVKRSQLNAIIANKALIYQYIDNDEFGYEVYTKQQYIDLVSTQTTTFKNLEIMKSITKNGKIVEIRFKK